VAIVNDVKIAIANNIKEFFSELEKKRNVKDIKDIKEV
jgi:hypothetical protein